MSNPLITVFDTESNGLLEEATVIHCAVTKDNMGIVHKFSNESTYSLLHILDDSDIIVCHNALAHDLPLLEKLYGYKHKGIVLDTLVFSRLLQPERVGRHSLEAWGERFGVPKVQHEDWTTFTPEMLHRCDVDVDINFKVLYALLEEAEMSEEDLWMLPTY
ncbi:MAG: hypothetical protein OCD76_07220 [Reichenbachiella sp.]